MTRLSLTTRVALLFALWTAIPLGVVAIYNHFAAREQLRASTRAQNLQAARGTVEKLDLYLQDILNGVRTVASVPSLAKFLAGRGIREAASDAQASILGLRKIGGYEALYLTDQLGTVILATERRFLGRSYLAARWFRAAAAGQELADEFRFDTEDRRVYLHLSAPVRNAGGVIVGALVGRVTTAPIDRMVAGDSGYSGRGDFGLLWDDVGIRLSHGTDPSRRFRPMGRLAPDLREILVFEERFGPETAKLLEPDRPETVVADKSRLLLYDPHADPFLDFDSQAAGRTVAAMVALKSKRWVYGIFTPESEIYAQLGGQTRRAVWLAVLACLVAMTSGVFLAGRLLRPIRAVAEAARGIAAGDMTRRAGLRGNDEASQLALTFDSMADALVKHTAELEAAHERERAEEALRLSEERYRSLIENAAYGICRVSGEGAFVAVNPALVEMLGYDSGEQLAGLSLTESVWSVAEEHGSIWESCRQGGKFEGVECSWRRRDGGAVSVRLSGRGVAGGLDIIVENVIERKVLEERVRQSQKMEAVGRLAGGVAHDFNNMLTVINGYCDMLLDRMRTSDPSREPLKAIRQAGERAAALTKQLLAFGRKQVLEPKPLNLNHAIVETESMLRRLLTEDIELVRKLDPHLGQTLLDGSQLQQVLLNLAVNARDAMPNGGRIVVETANADRSEADLHSDPEARPGRFVRLSVTDSGVGMEEKVRVHIFEPFFTTKERGKGTGLGLATVYGIVKQSEGWISVYSEPGHGTTFRLYFPRIETSVPDAPPPEASAVSPAGHETVLVAEDQDELRHLVVQVLAGLGYQVLAAETGAEALRLCAEQPGGIDLLLTDVVMPGMNGRELAERIAVLCPRAKVVFMSGYPDDVIAQRGVLEPRVHYLPKPFTPRRLAAKLQEVLRGDESEEPAEG